MPALTKDSNPSSAVILRTFLRARSWAASNSLRVGTAPLVFDLALFVTIFILIRQQSIREFCQHKNYLVFCPISQCLTSRRNDSTEPREAVVADVTGDGKNDLIVLVHDRILVYPQE